VSSPERAEPEPPRLLLDEMHAPVVARTLRDRGHDVIAVAEEADMYAMLDRELYRWAAERGRRIVTENIKDFRRVHAAAHESGAAPGGLLYTSSRTFPRSRRNPGPLIEALDTWLAQAGELTPDEDWLGSA
jgi:hypothetical protein